MLLELLLEEEELSASTVRALQRTYDLQSQDAEVRPHTHMLEQVSVCIPSSIISSQL